MRRTIVRFLLGRKRFEATQAVLQQALDDMAGCVTDPEMYKTADDLEVVRAVRKEMRLVDSFWFPNQYTSFYEMTSILEEDNHVTRGAE